MAKGKKSTPADQTPAEEIRLEVNTPPHQVHLVKVADIKPDPNQPRKFYRQEEIDELSESFKKHGVLQAITIRPKDDGFYIVFGERRYRAATQIGLKEIPATIKSMSDEDALEIQIIENLQRKDVHPMEEAGALAKLCETLKAKDVADRIGKSEKYVAVRVKLMDLIPVLQEMFFMNKISFEAAKLLSRQSAESQHELYDNKVGDNDWRNEEDDDEYFQNINYLLNNHTGDLSEATFDLIDADLYKKAGACSTCVHNSKNHLALFEEDEHKCYSPACFEIKTNAAYERKLNEVIETEPDVLFAIASSYIYREEEKEKIAQVKKRGIAVLEYGEWHPLHEPEPIGSWEEYQEEHAWWRKDPPGENDEDEIADREKEMREDFDCAVDDYEAGVKQYNQAKETGRIRKAFIIVGNSVNEGKVIDIVLKEKGVAKADIPAGSNVEEISKIQRREDRNKELDDEKIWQAVRKIMEDDKFSALMHDSLLDKIERKATAMAIYESLGYYEREYFQEDYLKIDGANREVAELFDNLTNEQYNMLCRLLIRSKLYPAPGSHTTGGAHYWGKKVAELHKPNEVKAIELEIEEKAIKRAERVQKKIKELQPKETVTE